jgi:uncharacterized membrane protein YebE (DUF533 family)
MADLTKILGVLMATGLAGRSSKMGAMAAATPLLFGKGGSGGGFSFGQKAGLAALGYLAYKAYSDGKIGSAPPQPEPQKSGGIFGSLLGSLGLGGSSQPSAPSAGFGDRLASSLRGPAAPPAIENNKALLLIRAMVAAAHADGDVSWEERQAIMGRLDQAGAGPEERRLVEYELSNPTPVEAIIREAQAPDTAAEVYLASNIAIRVDTDAERAYMDYLASRLRLTPAARQELDRLL